MRVTLPRLLAAAALALAPVAASAQAPEPDPDPARGATPSWVGVWRNTNNTVHIKAAPCGNNMCAIVVWANDQTKAAVAAKGRNIIGMQLLRDFRRVGPSQWRGTVYVPDIGITVAGKLTMTDRNTLAAVGCGFLGLICQTRHWQRLS